MKIPSNWWRRLGLGSLGMLLIVALGYVVMRSGPLAPTRVTVTHATVGILSPSLFGIGTVEARRSYLIGPTVAGRVSKVWVDVGDTVTSGQLLAEMDPVDLDERGAALEAALARASSLRRVCRSASTASRVPGRCRQRAWRRLRGRAQSATRPTSCRP